LNFRDHPNPFSAQVWEKYNLDNAPAVNGISPGSYNKITAYIGRGRRNCLVDCGFNIGRIQTTPSGAGAYYTTDLSASEIFDNATAEYLVKNANDTYIWEASSDGVRVENAIKSSDPQPFYIGMTIFDHNVFIGKVRPGKGLFYSDIGETRRVTGSYAVLTCFSSTAPGAA
jgi:hypothetical protein